MRPAQAFFATAPIALSTPAFADTVVFSGAGDSQPVFVFGSLFQPACGGLFARAFLALADGRRMIAPRRRCAEAI